MGRNNFLFFISGFISLLLFSLLFGMVVYAVFINSKKPIYALKKDNYVSVSVEFKAVAPKKKDIAKEIEHRENLPVTKEQTPVKKIEIEDLFSSVWTKDIKKIEKKKETKKKRRILELEKKIETLKSVKKQKVSEIVEKFDSNSTNKPHKASTGDEINEYLAKINAIVYKYFNPPENSQGNSVKASIELSAMGKVLDFRILNYSSNQYLNEECDKIKERLKSVIFPVNPSKKRSITIVILTSKE